MNKKTNQSNSRIAKLVINHKMQNTLAMVLLLATTLISGHMSYQAWAHPEDSRMESVTESRDENQPSAISLSANMVDNVGQAQTTSAASETTQTQEEAVVSDAQVSDAQRAETQTEQAALAAQEQAEQKAREEAQAKEREQAEQKAREQAEQKAKEEARLKSESAGSPIFLSNGLLSMTRSARAQKVSSLLLSIPGHKNGAKYHKTSGLDALIDELSVSEATWVIHTIEGAGFGQTASGYAGIDSAASHRSFVAKQVNKRFGGNIRTLLKKWGTYSYGGY